MVTYRICYTDIACVCRSRVTRQQVTGLVAKERWHGTSTQAPVKLPLATGVIQVSAVSDESKARNISPQSRNCTRRAFKPINICIIARSLGLSIPFLAFAKISPCTPGSKLYLTGNQVKVLGLMIVEDDLTKLEVIRRSITYRYTVKFHLVWMGQASIHWDIGNLHFIWEHQAIRCCLSWPGSYSCPTLWSQADLE